ncbi:MULTISPECIES: hypothetical protein [Saccharibacillus]|uniref:hypothetical protein n=1 Tax=Saccharibacillus TaxID=456492 RepID=UPI001239F74C|nr:hypothetical protein [Saccharibacillus sp. WB 17]MWJ33850.1 hypothetical protein [Saccharibacillus sp. WB 17]
MRKTSSVLLMVLILFYGFQFPVNAESKIEYANDTIQASIYSDLQNQYVSSLNMEKEQFKTNGDFNNAKLGEGIATYQIEIEDYSFTLKGYEFPLILDDEVIGTIEAEKNEGDWSITNISTISDLPSEIEEAEREAGNDNAIQYIHDKRYKIKGFYIQNTAEFFDSINNQVYDMDSFRQSIDTFKADQSSMQMKDSSGSEEIQVGGGVELLEDSEIRNIPLITALIAVLFLGVGVALLYKMKKN